MQFTSETCIKVEHFDWFLSGRKPTVRTYFWCEPLTFDRKFWSLNLDSDKSLYFLKKIFLVKRTEYKISESEEDQSAYYHTQEDVLGSFHESNSDHNQRRPFNTKSDSEKE